MKRVPIYNKRHDIVAYAIVDDEDFERVDARPWSLDSDGYAYGRAYDGALRPIGMHRFVLGVGHGPYPGHQQIVDHINGERLDNRRSNLRIVDASGNGQNRRPMVGGTSRYRGVSHRPDRNRWRAHAKLNGRFIHIGHFLTEEEAAKAAADFRAAHMPYSEEARLAAAH